MKRDWKRARRALNALLEDPDQTQYALEIFYALEPERHEHELRRMLAEPEGRRLFAERPQLLDRLADRTYLEGLPAGSLGRAYLQHIDRFGLDPAKLIELRRATDPRWPGLDAAHRWYVERSYLMHDLWHVLTGYGADGLGEAALLPFTLAQIPSPAQAFLSLGAGLRSWPLSHAGWRWPRYLWRAWRRGRNAVRLIALPYEDLLPLPLDEVRLYAGMAPPERVHPEGVLVAPAAA